MSELNRVMVVLVHGAFADVSGFCGSIRELAAADVRAVAPPNPLRGLADDAAVVVRWSVRGRARRPGRPLLWRSRYRRGVGRPRRGRGFGPPRRLQPGRGREPRLRPARSPHAGHVGFAAATRGRGTDGERYGAGWKSVPSWYQIARHDNGIAPEVQRFTAARTGSIVEEADGSHTALVAHPARTAELIQAALAKA